MPSDTCPERGPPRPAASASTAEQYRRGRRYRTKPLRQTHSRTARPGLQTSRIHPDWNVGQRPWGRYCTSRRQNTAGAHVYSNRLYSMTDARRSRKRTLAHGRTNSRRKCWGRRGYRDCSGRRETMPHARIPAGRQPPGDATIAATVLATVTSARAGPPLSTPR
jgi:hypothetical protein